MKGRRKVRVAGLVTPGAHAHWGIAEAARRGECPERRMLVGLRVHEPRCAYDVRGG